MVLVGETLALLWGLSCNGDHLLNTPFKTDFNPSHNFLAYPHPRAFTISQALCVNYDPNAY